MSYANKNFKLANNQTLWKDRLIFEYCYLEQENYISILQWIIFELIDDLQ